MEWIVLGESKGKIQLISKRDISGILPKGSFLTIDQKINKHILRVDNSNQIQPYSPSPMIMDMDLSALMQDKKCQNVISAFRVKDISDRDDGLIDFIRPQNLARRSTQEEVNLAVNSNEKGPKVFLATVQSNQNQLLIDDRKKFITVNLPEDMFWHQILICGKTGSGKTVSLKYLAQYFVEELGGAVLAVNVKESDLLKMNEPSKTNNVKIHKEWRILEKEPKGMRNFVVYHPANVDISYEKGIKSNYTQAVTLDIQQLDPDSLSGLLQNITSIGAQNLPNILRYWQKEKMIPNSKFQDFVDFFSNADGDNLEFKTMNEKGDISDFKLHRGTFENVRRNLDIARDFFDNENAKCLNALDILRPYKMSVIDVAVKNGNKFGAVLLRDLLHKIVEYKNKNQSDLPVLIIIDEVHMFFNTDSLSNALGDLDTICRTGRSKKIGVIFASQNPKDIPKGLSSVINTKIFFKTDAGLAKNHGIRISSDESETLKAGYCITNIHNMPQVKIIKFPLALAGVFEDE